MKENTFRIIIVTLLLHQTVFSQVKKDSFTLKGKIKGIPEGKFIRLSTGYVSTKAADWTLTADSAIVSNRNFLFQGTISYPHGVRIYYDDNNIHFQSGIFFIERGIQLAEIDISIQNGITPIIKGSKSNDLFIKDYHIREIEREELGLIEKVQILYKQYKNNIPETEKKIFYQSREEYYFRRDSFLLSDLKKNHNSFIPLWLVTEYLQKYGYKPIYYSVYKRISSKIKSTKTGNFLKNEIDKASSIDIGKIFPSVYTEDTSGKQQMISFNLHKEKYILIDFWFSHCVPCIAQFPELAEIYELYKSKGFEIISISVDKLSDKREWLNAISKYKLKWPQYLDADHNEASRLSVNIYPTSFLLGSDGKIIAKNMELSELSNFLQKNLQ